MADIQDYIRNLRIGKQPMMGQGMSPELSRLMEYLPSDVPPEPVGAFPNAAEPVAPGLGEGAGGFLRETEPMEAARPMEAYGPNVGERISGMVSPETIEQIKYALPELAAAFGASPSVYEGVPTAAPESPVEAPVEPQSGDPGFMGPVAPESPLPPVEGPGDLAAAREQMTAQEKLDRLSAARGLAEGLGQIGTATVRSLKGEGPYRGKYTAETLRRREAAAEKDLELQNKAEAEATVAAAKAAAESSGLKALKPKEVEAWEAGKNMIAELQDIGTKVDQMKGSLGPLDSRMDYVAGVFGLSSPDVAEFRMQVTAQLNAYIKAMTGAQMSEKEARRLMTGMPSLKDTHEVFRRKLERTIKTVEAKQRTWLRSRKSLGYDLSFAEPARYVRIAVPGEKEPFHIPAEDKDRALQMFPGAEYLGDVSE